MTTLGCFAVKNVRKKKGILLKTFQILILYYPVSYTHLDVYKRQDLYQTLIVII